MVTTHGTGSCEIFDKKAAITHPNNGGKFMDAKTLDDSQITPANWCESRKLFFRYWPDEEWYEVPYYVPKWAFRGLEERYHGCEAYRFRSELKGLIEYGKNVVEKLEACHTQEDRLKVYYDGNSWWWSERDWMVLEKSVRPNIGSERDIDEMWEVIYALGKLGSVSLVERYVSEATTEDQLWRLYLCLEGTQFGVCATPKVRIFSRLLELAGADESRRMRVLNTIAHGGLRYRDYVRTRFGKRFGG